MWPPWSLASRLHHPEALVPPGSVPMGAQGLARRVPTVSPWCPPAPVPLCPPSQGGGSGGGHVEGPGARCSRPGSRPGSGLLHSAGASQSEAISMENVCKAAVPRARGVQLDAGSRLGAEAVKGEEVSLQPGVKRQSRRTKAKAGTRGLNPFAGRPWGSPWGSPWGCGCSQHPEGPPRGTSWPWGPPGVPLGTFGDGPGDLRWWPWGPSVVALGTFGDGIAHPAPLRSLPSPGGAQQRAGGCPQEGAGWLWVRVQPRGGHLLLARSASRCAVFFLLLLFSFFIFFFPAPFARGWRCCLIVFGNKLLVPPLVHPGAENSCF